MDITLGPRYPASQPEYLPYLGARQVPIVMC